MNPHLLLLLIHAYDIIPDIIHFFYTFHIDLCHLIRLESQFLRDLLDFTPVGPLIAEYQLVQTARLTFLSDKRILYLFLDRNLIEDLRKRRVDHIFQHREHTKQIRIRAVNREILQPLYQR